MERKPYIGITGLETQEQTRYILVHMTPTMDYDLMIGVLMSSKSALGVPTRYPHRYPRPKDVPNIFLKQRGVLNLIHYSTDTQERLLAQISTVADFGYPFCNGLQLNMAWPSPEKISLFKRLYKPAPSPVLVLQCGQRALSMVGIHADQMPNKQACNLLATRINRYGETIDYVLLDMSGGHGKLLEIPFTRTCLEGLYAKDVYPKIGIAGGLSAETLPGVAELFETFPGLSIDAQGGLRDASDHLDLVKALAYRHVAERYLCR